MATKDFNEPAGIRGTPEGYGTWRWPPYKL